MTWVITEKQGSRKFSITDEAPSAAVITLVCASGSSGDTVDTLWDQLTSAYPIGKPLPSGSVPNSFQPSGTFVWYVDSYSGARPASTNTSTSQVYYVDVNISYLGPVSQLTGVSNNTRRDVEIMFTGISRTAQTWIDWDSLDGLPSESDTDWSNANPSNLRITGTRVDVNGRPMPKSVHQQRLTVNVYGAFDVDAASTTAYTHQGKRAADGTIFGVWAGSKVLFDSMEIVQIKHGYQRATFRFICDWFNHLEQELCTAGEGNQMVIAMSSGSENTTEITRSGSTSIKVFHAEAVWRQPYKKGTWTLSDVLGSDAATYVAGLFS
jgi:hypothetical protein